MRFSLFVSIAAALAGLAAAQNSTDGATGPSQDLTQCLVSCSGRAVSEHPGPAQKCIDAKSDQEQTACICRSDELLSALESCLTSTCPDLVGGLNLEQQCKLYNGAPGLRSVGMLPALVASGVVAVGALLL